MPLCPECRSTAAAQRCTVQVQGHSEGQAFAVRKGTHYVHAALARQDLQQQLRAEPMLKCAEVNARTHTHIPVCSGPNESPQPPFPPLPPRPAAWLAW
eukprot:1145058-Pelagomonas_calceolata.AAC.1